MIYLCLCVIADLLSAFKQWPLIPLPFFNSTLSIIFCTTENNCTPAYNGNMYRVTH